MEKVLVWKQAGEICAVYEREIVSIVGKPDGITCSISVRYNDRPIDAAISITEVFKQLGIKHV